jgi:methyl-accepting chemotaxis protein
MVDESLDTTNMWLAIMAIVSVLEGLVLIGIGVGGVLVYRRVMTLVNDLETRQVAPLREKVESILLDVKGITAAVSHQTERVDHAISGTMDRVDETAERVKETVKDNVDRLAGIVRGVRAVIQSLFESQSRARPRAV